MEPVFYFIFGDILFGTAKLMNTHIAILFQQFQYFKPSIVSCLFKRRKQEFFFCRYFCYFRAI